MSYSLPSFSELMENFNTNQQNNGNQSQDQNLRQTNVNPLEGGNRSEQRLNEVVHEQMTTIEGNIQQAAREISKQAFLDTSVESMRQVMREELTPLRQQVNNLDQKVNNLDQKVNNLDQKVNSLEQNVNAARGDIDSLSTGFNIMIAQLQNPIIDASSIAPHVTPRNTGADTDANMGRPFDRPG